MTVLRPQTPTLFTLWGLVTLSLMWIEGYQSFTSRTSHAIRCRRTQQPDPQQRHHVLTDSLPATRTRRPRTIQRVLSLNFQSSRGYGFISTGEFPCIKPCSFSTWPTKTTTTSLYAIPDFHSYTGLVSSLFRSEGQVPLWQAFGLNALLFVALRSKVLQLLTPEGFIHALGLGTVLWNTLGWRGWTLCVLYLFLGSLVTKVKFSEKEKMGIAEGRGGRRGPENVWGSAATGLLCAVASIQRPSLLGIPSNLYILGYVASLATKLSDTFASEIGKAYGKTTFLITTLERVEPGTEGAVSLEGTAAAVVGGALLTLYGWAVGLITTPAIPISVSAAFVATNIESLLGATLQGKENLKWITNEVVNFLNTLIGAMIAIAAGMLFL